MVPFRWTDPHCSDSLTMLPLTAAEFADLHGDPAREFDAGELYCNACSRSFVPIEETSQKDEWCLCKSCREKKEEPEEGRIA